MSMLDLVLVRRILPLLEGYLTADQYADKRARSRDILLVDLGNFATQNEAANRTVYVVGLDKAAAFDSAAQQ